MIEDINRWWDRLPKSSRAVAMMLVVSFVLWFLAQGWDMTDRVPPAPDQSILILIWAAAAIATTAVLIFIVSLFVPVRRRRKVTNIVS